MVCILMWKYVVLEMFFVFVCCLIFSYDWRGGVKYFLGEGDCFLFWLNVSVKLKD